MLDAEIKANGEALKIKKPVLHILDLPKLEAYPSFIELLFQHLVQNAIVGSDDKHISAEFFRASQYLRG